MPDKIDLDRGVMMTSYQGVEIYMYLDDPGVYLNAYGTEVPESLARAAGLDVDKFSKQHMRKVRMAAAQKGIEDELAILEQNEGNHRVVKTVKDFKLVDVGLGRFKVEDPDGNALTKEPVTRALGDKLLIALADAEEKPKDPAPKAK